MTLPVIGITAYLEPEVRFGAWNVEAVVLPASYVRAIERAGGRALVVPPAEDGIAETLDALDGLLFSGGSDLDPALYGAAPHAETKGVREARDRAETKLLTAALERDLPILAVCRGSQVLNVVRGGDLVQHLPGVVGSDRHKHTPGFFADHGVELQPGSRLASILGERAPVKSHHHQGYGRVGDGLEVVAWADDGTPEALEDRSRAFAVGVLWHPEEDEDFALFRGLVDAALEYRAAR